MVSHIHGVEYGEWEFKRTVAVRRLSFTGWIDLFARRMPDDDEVSLWNIPTVTSPHIHCNDGGLVDAKMHPIGFTLYMPMTASDQGQCRENW